MKTAPFRCIVVYVVWLVIYIWIGFQNRGVIDIWSAVFGAAIFGFISYKIWQKFDPDYQGWTEGKDTVDAPPDNEYDSKGGRTL